METTLIGYFKDEQFVELCSTNESDDFVQFVKNSYGQTVVEILTVSSVA